jgi:hypothetical protein
MKLIINIYKYKPESSPRLSDDRKLADFFLLFWNIPVFFYLYLFNGLYYYYYYYEFLFIKGELKEYKGIGFPGVEDGGAWHLLDVPFLSFFLSFLFSFYLLISSFLFSSFLFFSLLFPDIYIIRIYCNWIRRGDFAVSRFLNILGSSFSYLFIYNLLLLLLIN